MTKLDLAMFSDQAVTASGVVYFLAFLAAIVQWTLLRNLPVQTGPSAELLHAGSSNVGGTTRSSTEIGWSAQEVVAARGERRRHAIATSERLALILTGIAAGIHLLALIARGLGADPARVPWGNMYEFTISGTFMLAATFLLLRRTMKLDWLTPIVLGTVLTLLMVAVIWLHQPIAPLPEALLSPWLVIHVFAAVAASAVFTLAGLVTITYLVKNFVSQRRRSLVEHQPRAGYLARVPDERNLEILAYRLHAFGFPLWTFGVLIAGPIWAHEAWSRYWNWDPKEVWAFITWVLYAAYLHARATGGARGRVAAILAILGLISLWFSFIGVNFFSTSSLHSYA